MGFLFHFLIKHFPEYIKCHNEKQLKQALLGTRLYDCFDAIERFAPCIRWRESYALVSMLLYASDPFYNDCIEFSVKHARTFLKEYFIKRRDVHHLSCFIDNLDTIPEEEFNHFLDNNFVFPSEKRSKFHAESEDADSVKLGEQTTGATNYRGTSELQNMGFSDNQDVTIYDMSEPADETRNNEDYAVRTALTGFMCRPRILHVVRWLVNDISTGLDNTASFLDFRVWNDMINATPLRDKANNYRMFRADGLKLTFRVNGSPFHYGRLYAGWCPGKFGRLPFTGMLNPHNQTLLPTNVSVGTTQFPLFTHYSQWPGVFIDPANNIPTELVIPFMWPENYASLTLNPAGNLNAIESLGFIKIWILNTLRHANDSTDPCNVTITGEFINPVLAMPTARTVFQGESEDPDEPKIKKDFENIQKTLDVLEPIFKGKTFTLAQIRASSFVAQSEQPRKAKPKLNDKAGSGAPQGSVPRTRNNKKKQVNTGGGDEYGEGLVSAPASALANFAGTLSAIPVIGPYATAAKIGLNKMSGIAKIFGFSRPTNVETTQFTSLKTVSPMAVVVGDDNPTKLVFDPKQEITVDPTVVGLQNIDEMALAHLFKRESYLFRVVWPSTFPAGGSGVTLFHIGVSPHGHPAFISTDDAHFHTALSWASTPFRYWRGTLKYRFQIVASQMHRGRLRFSFEPTAVAINGPPADNLTQFTQLVDLTECRDFTMIVRYGHYRPWMVMANPSAEFVTQTSFNATHRASFNGILSCYIQNELTSPVDTSIVDINCFVSAGDDFMVANPGSSTFEESTPYSAFLDATYVAESESADYVAPNESKTARSSTDVVLNAEESDTPDVDNQNLVFFGEQIVSLRALLKRYCHLRFDMPVTLSGNETNLVRTGRHYMLPSRGVAPTVASGSASILGNYGMSASTDDNGNYNYISTTLYHWYSWGYLGQRGNMRVKEVSGLSNNIDTNTFLVTRNEITAGTAWWTWALTTNFTVAAGTLSQRRSAMLAIGDAEASKNGIGIEFTRIKNSIEYEIPFYAPLRFAWLSILYSSSALTVTPTLNDPYWNQYEWLLQSSTRVEYPLGSNALTSATYLQTFVACGEDFSFHYFLGAPVLGFSNPVLT